MWTGWLKVCTFHHKIVYLTQFWEVTLPRFPSCFPHTNTSYMHCRHSEPGRLSLPHTVWLAFFVWFVLGDLSFTSCPSLWHPLFMCHSKELYSVDCPSSSSSYVSKHPNLNVLAHSNPSSATWSTCSEEAEIFGLWKAQCSFVSVGEKLYRKYVGFEHRAFVFPLRATSSNTRDEFHKRIWLCGKNF